jgi:hypothetical protein
MGARALGPLLAATLLAAPAAGAPPRPGNFAPETHLGGVEIGMTKAQVTRLWGKRHGVCRECRRTTWYFNYRPFEPQGVAVVFERNRVAYVFTVWRPNGWRTARGLTLGAPASEISKTYGPLDRRECGRGMPRPYYALVRPGLRAQTVFYVFRDRLWGFGLTVPDASPCL